MVVEVLSSQEVGGETATKSQESREGVCKASGTKKSTEPAEIKSKIRLHARMENLLSQRFALNFSFCLLLFALFCIMFKITQSYIARLSDL